MNNKLDTLKEELKQAVRVENYEKAAEIRDKINEIENDINEDKKGE